MEQSPLSRLPREIRDQVYDIAQRHEKIILKDNGGKWRASTQPKCSHLLALSICCRQLRHEALAMFYANNAFIFHGIDFAGVSHWVRDIGVARSALTRILHHPPPVLGWRRFVRMERDIDALQMPGAISYTIALTIGQYAVYKFVHCSLDGVLELLELLEREPKDTTIEPRIDSVTRESILGHHDPGRYLRLLYPDHEVQDGEAEG